MFSLRNQRVLTITIGIAMAYLIPGVVLIVLAPNVERHKRWAVRWALVVSGMICALFGFGAVAGLVVHNRISAVSGVLILLAGVNLVYRLELARRALKHPQLSELRGFEPIAIVPTPEETKAP
jgi:hypothetical protein